MESKIKLVLRYKCLSCGKCFEPHEMTAPNVQDLNDKSGRF